MKPKGQPLSLGKVILYLFACVLLFELVHQIAGTYLAATIWIIIIIGVWFLYSYLMNERWKRKLLQLNGSRPQLEKEAFTTFFIQKGYKKEYIDIAYGLVKNFISSDSFSMYPDDDIYKLYRIDPEDFSDLIYEIFIELKRDLPPQNEIDPINEEFKNKMSFEYILKLLSISSSNE